MKKLHFIIALVALFSTTRVMSQAGIQNPSKTKIAILNIDARDILQTSEVIVDLARIELQKKQDYITLRKYDIQEILASQSTDYSSCYSIQCLSDVGKLLGVDEMIGGSVTRIGEKIIIDLILIDVQSSKMIDANVNEYFNFEGEIAKMLEISINYLLNQPNDPLKVNALEANDMTLMEQSIEKSKLNGPRMGVAYVTGTRARRMQDPIEKGGYDMYPIMSQIGYQFELQYLSAGNLQALVEFIPLLGGLDQGMFVPSISILNGFRFSRSGIEFAFGPSIRIGTADMGYYDDHAEGDKKWHLDYEWEIDHPNQENPNKVVKAIDRRGSVSLSTGWIWAIGKTFRSGHLNIPVNVYISPSKEGWLMGAGFGFNIKNK